jgi:flagellar FliL protein
MAKAAPNKEDKKKTEETEGAAPAAKKKGKLPLLLGLVVLLAAAGGGAWFFLFKDKGTEAQQPAKAQAPKPPVFVPLDTFTVNLSADEGGQYLQVGATLRVLDQAAADAVKQYMPEIRHRTLGLLASKKPSEIAGGEGRERLAEELRQHINNILLAAAGRPVKPIALEVPVPAGETAPATESKPAEAPAEAARPAEGTAPQEGAAAAEGATADGGAAAPAAAPAPRRATLLARAAEDDPAQGVLFTSFIIQ